MILYLDSSALVPLLVDEPSSALCRQIWAESETVIVTRLVYVETCAAFAQAERLGRVTRAEHEQARDRLEAIWEQCGVYELDARLMRRAGVLSDQLALRGYDAVHCAAAESLHGEEIVAATGDRKLIEAWLQLGIATIDTNGPAPEPG